MSNLESNLFTKLQILNEAPLSPERVRLVDEIIAKLETMKTMDFGPTGEAGKSAFVNALQAAHYKVRYAAQYGKTAERLQAIENSQIAQAERLKERRVYAAKTKRIVEQFAEQYPRLITVSKDTFSMVQPNGANLTLSYSLDREDFVNVMYAFRKLYRKGVYEEVQQKVQEIRDFGFNISSKQLSTEYSSFRTRYTVLSSLVLSYQGPMVSPKGEILDMNVPGSCKIQFFDSTIGPSNEFYDIQNVKIGHLGEIIDTIDVVCHVLYNLGRIKSIECMGEDVVDYVVQINNRKSVTISSSEITNTKDLGRLIYQRSRAS